jgi:short-subunit dehydrogenase
MKNKTVIITGASSGIGEALAEKFAKEGANVVIAARSADKLNVFAEKLQKFGTQVLAVPTDVTKKEDCQCLIEKCVAKFGGVDVLINNAGISMRALFEQSEVEVIEKLMDVNFYGTVYCTKSALPHILASKGSIVGVSSIAGYRGLPARTGYSASKFAMQGFLEALRTEIFTRGVNVLVACPGFTSSNIRKVALTGDGSQQGDTPLNEENLMSAEECATHIYNAIVKRKRTIVLTTQGKLTVFLNKLFPGFMDKMVLNHFKKEPDNPFKDI